jgi:hypothetical protein
MGALIAIILWLGLYPQPVLKTITPALHQLELTARPKQIVARPPADALAATAIHGHSLNQSVWPQEGGNL